MKKMLPHAYIFTSQPQGETRHSSIKDPRRHCSSLSFYTHYRAISIPEQRRRAPQPIPPSFVLQYHTHKPSTPPGYRGLHHSILHDAVTPRLHPSCCSSTPDPRHRRPEKERTTNLHATTRHTRTNTRRTETEGPLGIGRERASRDLATFHHRAAAHSLGKQRRDSSKYEPERRGRLTPPTLPHLHPHKWKGENRDAAATDQS